MRWFIYSLIALSPLPLASARPVWQWAWVVYIGLMLVTYLVTKWRHPRPKLPKSIMLSLTVIFLSSFVWGLVQAFAQIGITGSVNVENVDGLLSNLGTISIAPSLTLSVAVQFLAHIVFLYLVYSYASRRDRAVHLFRFIGIVVAIYAAYGFAIYVSGNETVLWFERWGYYNSLTSTFVNRNSYAAYAGMGLLCLLSYASFWIQDELHENRSGRELYRHILETMLSKAWWLPLAIILVGISLLLSNSRAGFASVVLALFVWMLISPNRYRGDISLWRRVGVLTLFAVVGMGLFSLSGDLLERRLNIDATFDQRFQAFPIILDIIAEHPWTGLGFGTFDDVFRVYRDADVTAWLDRAHNDYLELAMTAGLPAATFIIFSIAAMGFYLASRLKFGVQYRSFIALGVAVMIQLGLHSLVDFSLQMPANSYLWSAILGASIAVAQRCEASHKRADAS